MSTPASTPLPDDLVTLKQALALLRPTPRPTSMSTLRRWISKYCIEQYTFFGTGYVSFSDVVEAQRDASQEHPRP